MIVDGTLSDRRDTDTFANRRTNPSIGDVTCNALFRIVLVLDRSGSIQQNGVAAYKNAVTGFVNDLVGTNTDVGIVSFAASSALEAGYTSVLGRSIRGAHERHQQRLQQHGRRHQLGCRPVRRRWPVQRRLQTSSSWSRTATPP